MLASAAFNLFVDLTDLQEYEHLNREALEAGKHVWSEKPIANSLDAGRELLDGTESWPRIHRRVCAEAHAPQDLFENAQAPHPRAGAARRSFNEPVRRST
jgi:hypothetical protein